MKWFKNTIPLRNKCLVLCGLFFLNVLFVQAQTRYNSKITKAYLFNDGAYLQSVAADVEVTTGLNEIIITGLPLNVKKSSINLALSNVNVRIVDLEIITDSTGFKNDKVVQRIERELRSANDSMRGIQFSESRLQFLNKTLLANNQIEVSDKSIYVDDLDELLIYYRNKLRELNNEKERIKHHKKLISRQIDSLNTAKHKRITTLGYPSTYLNIEISSQINTTVPVRIFYQSPLANWQPEYTISGGAEDASLSMTALIQQNTGFQWQQVDISLGYGSISKKLTNAYQPNTTLQLSQVERVESNQPKRIFDVMKIPLSVKQFYLCQPNDNNLSQLNYVFGGLMGEYLPQGKLTIISNNYSQVFDTLQSALFLDSLSYSLGYTNEVTCVKTLSKEKLKKSLIGGKNTQILEWTISISNNTNAPQKVVLADMLPTFDGEEIQYEFNLPKGASHNNSNISYTATLQGGETTEITYGFQITAPKGASIFKYFEY